LEKYHLRVVTRWLPTPRHVRCGVGENLEITSKGYLSPFCFRELAETVTKYVRKGRLVHVRGRINIRNYTPDDGITRYMTEIVADQVKFLDKPATDAGDNSGTGSGQQRGGQGQQQDSASSDQRNQGQQNRSTNNRQQQGGYPINPAVISSGGNYNRSSNNNRTNQSNGYNNNRQNNNSSSGSQSRGSFSGQEAPWGNN
jgi:single stranded DNA-binding protein